MGRRTRTLSSDDLTKWRPTRQEDRADPERPGLFYRGGPSGRITFFFWADEEITRTVVDPVTGDERQETAKKRKRVPLGPWSLDGSGGGLSLGEARDLYKREIDARRTKARGAGGLTVSDIADRYRRDILSDREREAEAWNVIRVHVVEAQPDPARSPFGQWSAQAVKAKDIAEVIDHAKKRRKVGARKIGGPGAARVVLRELRAIFANAVTKGLLDSTPAAVATVRGFKIQGTARDRFLDADEIKAFFEVLDLTALLQGTAKEQRLSPTIRLALAFQLYVPLRTHSLMEARWAEFDLTAARWTVPVEHLKLKKAERKTARPFVVPLPETAVAILRKLKEEAGDSPWALASPVPIGEDEDPKHIEEKALIRALARLQRSGRLAFGARFTVHDLRRTWRTWAMDLGVDHVAAERSLGHVAVLRAAGFSGAADAYGRGQMVEQRAAAAELVAAAFDRIRLGEAAPVVPLRERVSGARGSVVPSVRG